MVRVSGQHVLGASVSRARFNTETQTVSFLVLLIRKSSLSTAPSERSLLYLSHRSLRTLPGNKGVVKIITSWWEKLRITKNHLGRSGACKKHSGFWPRYNLVVSDVISALATNDNMIAIAPSPGQWAAVGIAAPLDAISAVFSNPAAMCFGPIVHLRKSILTAHYSSPGACQDHPRQQILLALIARDTVYAIPAIGLSVPITDKFPFWRFGLAAYGSDRPGSRLPGYSARPTDVL